MPSTDGPAQWTGDTAVPLCHDTIGDLLRRAAARHGDRPALLTWVPGADGAGRLEATTYAELLALATRAALRLAAEVPPGGTVACWSGNRSALVVLEHAVALAGLVLAPLNPALTDAEATDLVARSGASVLLAAREHRGSALLERARGIGPRLGLARVDDVDSALAPGDTPSPGGLPEVDAGDPFLVQFTSGTTGTPRGAVLSQLTVLNVGVAAAASLRLPEGVVWCNAMPLHHVGASVCVLMPVLAVGGTVVLLPEFDAGLVLALVARTGAHVVGLVPTMLVALLEHPDRAGHDLSSLQVLQIGGSTVLPSLIRRAERELGGTVVNAYGLSEAPSVAQTRLEDSDEVKATTIGRAGPHREVRVVRAGTTQTADVGERGELQVRGPLTLLHYLGDPELTSAVRGADGWFATGDLVSMAPDGLLSFCGRSREVVIRGGENIDPAEVEEVLMRHPAVAEVAVVGAPDERWGEQVAAFVRLRPGSPVAWEELERHAREALASFKVPRVWRAVEAMPLTPSGKIRKFVLQEML